VLAVAVLAAIGLVVAALAAPVDQPIAFNHRVHLEAGGLECVDCHAHALDGARATIPGTEVCAPCHSEPQGSSAAEAAVVAHVGAGTPIGWAQVHWVPDHVYFSHRRHTTQGRIACEVCHGNVRERVLPFTRPAVRPRMAWCTKCHDKTEAQNDCIACHR
jgi:hypothetical protein